MADVKHFKEASQDFAEDFGALREDVAKLTASVSELVRSQASSATNAVMERTESVRQRLSDGAAEAQNRLRGVGADIEATIERSSGADSTFRRFPDRNAEKSTYMRSLTRRLVNDAAEPFERLSAQFVKKGALFMLGVFCLGVSLVFFTIALNGWLKSLAGTEIAALGIGMAYLGLGLALLVPISAASRKSANADHPTPVPSPPKPDILVRRA